MIDRLPLFGFPLAFSLMAFGWVACEKKYETPPDEIRVVMENETGGHMTRFDLDYGYGQLHYEIFSKGYVFSQNIPAPNAETPMHLTFHDDAGKKINYSLEHPLSTDMGGGTLWLYFEPEGVYKMRMDWP